MMGEASPDSKPERRQRDGMTGHVKGGTGIKTCGRANYFTGLKHEAVCWPLPWEKLTLGIKVMRSMLSGHPPK
jgi:hypothetical protein